MSVKKKGFTLIFTLVIIMLLVVLATSVLSLAVAGFINSKNVENSNKLKLVAESGIDRGSQVLKDYILKHSEEVLKDIAAFNPAAVNDVGGTSSSRASFTEGNITCTVSYLPDLTLPADPEYPNYKFKEINTHRDIDYLIIRSVARDNRSGKTKSVDAIIDKKAISNVYFERLFKSSFTVVPKARIPSIPYQPNQFTLSGGIDFDISGTMFLQTDNFILNPNSFLMHEGNIYKKGGSVISNTITPKQEESDNSIINMYKDDGTYIKDKWKNTPIRSIRVLNVIAKDIINKADDMHDFDINGEMDEAHAGAFIKMKGNTLITFKAKKTSGQMNFQKIVNGEDLMGNKSGIYKHIVDKLKSDSDPVLAAQWEQRYGSFYKLLLLDGDLVIDDDNGENFNNYVIYCTGTVTFKGNANFYNSSIFANSIVYNTSVASPTNPTGVTKINFQGVNTADSKSHSVVMSTPDNPNPPMLKDFSDTDKGIINTYLIDNLESYGDYIEFKIVKWKEY